MSNVLRPLRAGFTLLEVMVSTAIMVVIVLTVVTIAADTMRVYDRAVADLSTQSEARGVLDALENDFSTAVLRADGRCWMEVVIPGGNGAPAGAPAPVGNVHRVDQPIVMLFSTPADRPRWTADATGRRQLRGDVCAVAYRLGHRSPFDMPGDFTPIATVGATPMVIVANPQRVPAANGREFIAALKAKPDGFNFGSGGTGTILHLAAEMFLDEAGAKARHIPYKGVGPMVTDLLGGQIDFAVAALPSVQQHIRSGALRALGMCGDKRTAAAPDIPTFVEQGLPGYVIDAWFGVLGPKGMSPAAVKKVNDALVVAFNDPAVKEAMAKQGNTIAISTPEQAQKAFRSEMERFAALVKKVGIEPQ